MKAFIPEDASYFDISPSISEDLGVFPGDTPYKRKINLDYETGSSLLLSEIQTTLHIGAHADAPNHYHPDGVGIGERTLAFYMGSAQVIHVNTPKAARISLHDLHNKEILAPRVLFKTSSFPDPNHWNQDFSSLSPELIHFLADHNVRLVGIDTPSIDPQNSKTLEAHQAIYQRQMAILEGIVLEDVPEGLYTLIALPLRLADADASPVRAILLKQNPS